MNIYHIKIQIILSLVLIILAVGGGITASAAELPVPTININPDVYYPFDEILYIEGRAKPNTVVEIQFVKQGAKPGKFNAKSNPNGEWVLAEKIPFETGDWEVRARAVIDKNNISEWSNPRVFKVIVSGVTIGGFNIKFAALALLLVVSLILGAVIVLYFVQRVRQLRSQLVNKEVRETHESVHRGLADIRGHLFEELKQSGSLKHKTAENIERKEHVLKELENIEQNIEREIGDVEDKLRE